ncbi:MAG TPA: polymer-forming cytoskeletal protein, partial [Steroidobacteraceae bacterium]
VHGVEAVTVRETARVRGNIFAPRVGLADGAKFTGRIDMDSSEVAASGSSSRSRTQASDHVLSEGAAERVLTSGT